MVYMRFLNYLWPDMDFLPKVMPACAGALMHLVTVMYQHVAVNAGPDVPASELWGIRIAQGHSTGSLAGVWTEAGLTTLNIAAAFTENDGSAATDTGILQSPQLLPFLCVSITAAAFSSQLPQMLPKTTPQHPDSTTQAPDSGSSSIGTSSGMSRKASSSKSTNSSGSRNSSTAEQQLRKLVGPSKAWEFGCRQQQQQLPASVDTLLQLVGTSAKGMLWGAATHAAQVVTASSRDSLPEGIAKSLSAVAEAAADRLQCLVCLYVIAVQDDGAQDRLGDLLFQSAVRGAVNARQDLEQQQQQVSYSTASQPPCPEMLVP